MLSLAFNVDIKFEYTQLPGAVVNDETLTQQAIEAAKEVGYNIQMMEEPLTIGEDFRLYERLSWSLLSLAQIVNMICIILNMTQMNVF